jgi:MoxR-like ATPase
VLLATTGEEAPRPATSCRAATFLDMQRTLRAVPVATSALEWVVAMVDATHEHPLVRLGASPRGAQALVLAAKGYALAAGRPHVELEDLRRATLPRCVTASCCPSRRRWRGSIPTRWSAKP